MSCSQCGAPTQGVGTITCGRSECQQGSVCDNHHRVKSKRPCPALEGCKLKTRGLGYNQPRGSR